MFDINIVKKRYFEIKLGEISLSVEPPKLKVLKKITSLAKAKNEDSINELAEAVLMILNKNKENYKITEEIVEDLDLDQMNIILTEYFEWLSKTKNLKN